MKGTEGRTENVGVTVEDEVGPNKKIMMGGDESGRRDGVRLQPKCP